MYHMEHHTQSRHTLQMGVLDAVQVVDGVDVRDVRHIEHIVVVRGCDQQFED